MLEKQFDSNCFSKILSFKIKVIIMNNNQMLKKIKKIDKLLKSRKEKRFETIYGADKTEGKITY